MGADPVATAGGVAWTIDKLGISGECDARAKEGDDEKVQSNQPLAPARRQGFYLAVRGSGPCADPPTHAILAHSPPEHDRSLQPPLERQSHEKSVGLRNETSQILEPTVVRQGGDCCFCAGRPAIRDPIVRATNRDAAVQERNDEVHGSDESARRALFRSAGRALERATQSVAPGAI